MMSQSSSMQLSPPSMDAALRSAVLKPSFNFPSSITHCLPTTRLPNRPLIVVVSGTFSDSDRCLIAPLEPRSKVGKLLNRMLLDDRQNLTVTARTELERLALQKDEALACSQVNRDSDEAFLYRRIAQLKEEECRIEVQDVIYALILSKFMDMRVHLVPKISQCLFNNRLEIWPRKDWELESIHSIEVLEMVREHINSTPGYKSNCSVKESWDTTQIKLTHLHNLYNASIFYGYFLKSASFRHTLESNLKQKQQQHLSYFNLITLPLSLISNYIGFGGIQVKGSSCFEIGKQVENLKGYVMGFKQETVEMCARPRSMEAVDIVNRHCSALFGDEGIEGCGLVATSFASVKRLVLEAVAFGSFLWDAEKCVESVYTLEDNAVF